MTSGTIVLTLRANDRRAEVALADASGDVGGLWARATGITSVELPDMGLTAGDRPTADVEVLAGALAAVEYELARRMHAAATAGALPLVGPGAMLSARGWAVPHARRLARAGALAAEHPTLAAAWAAGIITANHVDAIASNTGPLTADELAAVIAELADRWGYWSPAQVTRLVIAAARLLHPPPDPTDDEADAYQSRDLSFALLGDTVLLSGTLPRLEGEAVMAAIDALAERLRSTADHTPPRARRADALVELVNTAAANGALPTRGGLPVSLSVTLEHTPVGDPVWSTSRGHLLTHAEQRFSACDPTITPIGTWSLCATPGIAGPGVTEATPAARIAALAALLFGGPRLPLTVGRTSRTATPAQRKALAARDKGCIIPGCGIPAENCQAHHITDWAADGPTDIENLALLCWTHHRQVDLGMWIIQPAEPPPGRAGPQFGDPLATPWPGNNTSPWTIRRTQRTRWRL